MIRITAQELDGGALSKEAVEGSAVERATARDESHQLQRWM